MTDPEKRSRDGAAHTGRCPGKGVRGAGSVAEMPHAHNKPKAESLQPGTQGEKQQGASQGPLSRRALRFCLTFFLRGRSASTTQADRVVFLTRLGQAARPRKCPFSSGRVRPTPG